jgi:integrase
VAPDHNGFSHQGPDFIAHVANKEEIICQRVLAKVVAEANGLLPDRRVPEILECSPHTRRRTYIGLLRAAGCDPSYVQQQVGQTDPTREEYRTRVNELLATSPAALSRLPEPAHRAAVGPKTGPNSLLEAA